MYELRPHAFGPETLRYFRKLPHPDESRFHLLRYLLAVPFRTRMGANEIEAYVDDHIPPVWGEDFTGKRVLVVGSGPSVDRVDASFFAEFDTKIFVNFSVRLSQGNPGEYFFTADSGPMREYIDLHGADSFHALGPDRCIFAPMFAEQFYAFTEEGRKLLTWQCPDKASWWLETRKRGSLTLPFALRYFPRQPDWSNFSLPAMSRRMPMSFDTSAFSAVIFAAMGRPLEIGLIGCDFGGGRAQAVQSDQLDPSQLFSLATANFPRMAAAMARHGVPVTNHSWEV